MRVFLLASFPSLSLRDPAPLRLEELLTRCATHLSKEEMDELDAVCSLPPEGNSAFARRWAAAWQELNQLNVQQRARRLPPDQIPSLPPEKQLRFPMLQDAVAAAWEAPDPLRREMDLLLAQWGWLEDMRRAEPYSSADLCAYALQLKLLEQRDAWKEEDGAVQFEEQTKTFLSPVLDDLFPKESIA